MAENRLDIQAMIRLGNSYAMQGNWDQAIDAYQKVIAERPDMPGVFHNLGNVLHSKGEIDEAIVAYNRALRLHPANAEALCSLGNLFNEKKQAKEAIVAYQNAIIHQPDHVQSNIRLGQTFQELGQVNEAITAFSRLVALRPDEALGHLNLSLALQLRGELRKGWQEYEWRSRVAGAPHLPKLIQPIWNGEALDGRRILLYPEQGYGDAIQFVRYAPMVAQRGGKVILGCLPELAKLFSSVAGVEQVIPAGQRLPDFDLHRSLISMPLLFDTTLETIPAPKAYLFPDAALSENWRKRVANIKAKLKIGLAWAGGRLPHPDRSLSLSKLSPLAEISDVHFFSLQKGEAAQEARNPPHGMELTDWSAELNDFAQTAALMANMDLIVSIDTSVGHLAGALGKPTLLLLRFAADCRWLLHRSDSPWYPTMELFRQPCIGDWETPVKQIGQKIRTMCGSSE
jgi:hypothetical protein